MQKVQGLNPSAAHPKFGAHTLLYYPASICNAPLNKKQSKMVYAESRAPGQEDKQKQTLLNDLQ